MPFNISKFKTTFDKLGGPARANLFEVRMTRPKWMAKMSAEDLGYFTEREFTMFCKAVSFPGIAVNTTAFDYVGQLSRTVPSALTNPGPITFTFFCDSDHHTLRFFHMWMRHVLNYSAKGGAHAEWEGKLRHEVGFKSNYDCDLEIRHYSTDSRERSYYTAVLQGAFPISVSPLSLAWETNDSFLTLDVQFAFDNYEFGDDKAGNTGARSTRGAGLLDLLGDIAGFADTVRGTLKAGKPRSIQDAVNRIQRIGRSLDNVSDNIPSNNDNVP